MQTLTPTKAAGQNQVSPPTSPIKLQRSPQERFSPPTTGQNQVSRPDSPLKPTRRPRQTPPLTEQIQQIVREQILSAFPLKETTQRLHKEQQPSTTSRFSLKLILKNSFKQEMGQKSFMDNCQEHRPTPRRSLRGPVPPAIASRCGASWKFCPPSVPAGGWFWTGWRGRV